MQIKNNDKEALLMPLSISKAELQKDNVSVLKGAVNRPTSAITRCASGLKRLLPKHNGYNKTAIVKILMALKAIIIERGIQTLPTGILTGYIAKAVATPVLKFATVVRDTQAQTMIVRH